MKSRQSYTVRVVGLAAVLVTATACGGAKSKATDATGVAGDTTSTGVVSAAAAAPIKATGGGSFCKLYAASVNSAARHSSDTAPADAKAKIQVAIADAHQALTIAPSEIKTDVALLVGLSDKMYGALAKAGYDYSKLTPADMSAFSSPAVAAAEEHLSTYIKGTCGIDLATGLAAAAAASGAKANPAPAGGSTAAGGDSADGGKACSLVTAEQISTAAGKSMHSVGGAGDTICVFSGVDDPSFAMAITIYPDNASMGMMTQLESGGSEHLDGLGDDAFWNPALGTVFVKKGTRGFSFALPSFTNLTADPAAVKDKMVALGHEALSNF